MSSKKKIRVCHISSAHGQEDIRIFHKECASLANFGYEVFLIARGKTYDKNGVHIIGVSKEKVSRKERMLKVTREVYGRALEIDADIYHAHDPELLSVCLKLKKRGKAVVFDSHENVSGTIREKQYLPGFVRNVISNVYASYEKYVCRKLDAVVTATPNVSDYFRDMGCECVIDVCNFPILREYIEPDYCSRKIVYAGNLDDQWNQGRIVDAIMGIEGVEYVLCSIPEEDKLERLREKAGWEKVDYRGRVSFEKIPDVLAECAAGLAVLSPGNNTDGINGNMANTKIFEEMMAGLPVICTKFKRWKQFVEEYDCGICVDPHSEKEIQTAIERLIADPNEARRMGHNGRRAIEERFNWKMEEKKLLELYGKLGKAI